MEELGTARLRLRDWRQDDLEPLSAIYADPEVMKFIGDGSVRNREETEAGLALIRRNWADHGFGLFAVELRDTGELAGWVGLAVPHFLPAVEIGWRLGKPFWGRGIATEAAREVLRFGFEAAGLDRVVSICHVDNHASARVMTKLGLRQERLTTVPGHGRPVRVLALARDEYRAVGATGSG